MWIGGLAFPVVVLSALLIYGLGGLVVQRPVPLLLHPVTVHPQPVGRWKALDAGMEG